MSEMKFLAVYLVLLFVFYTNCQAPVPPPFGDSYEIRMNVTQPSQPDDISYIFEWYDYTQQMQRFATNTFPPSSDPLDPSDQSSITLYRFDLGYGFTYTNNVASAPCRSFPLTFTMQKPYVLQNATYEGAAIVRGIACYSWYVDYDGPTPYTFYTSIAFPQVPVELTTATQKNEYYDYVEKAFPANYFDVPSFCA